MSKSLSSPQSQVSNYPDVHLYHVSAIHLPIFIDNLYDRQQVAPVLAVQVS